MPTLEDALTVRAREAVRHVRSGAVDEPARDGAVAVEFGDGIELVQVQETWSLSAFNGLAMHWCR